jgi:hypothetical protein
MKTILDLMGGGSGEFGDAREKQGKRNLERLQRKLLTRMNRAHPSFLKDCEFRPIRTLDEYEAASRLVHMEYNRREATVPHKGKLWLSLAQITNQATTFITVYKKTKILNTITLVMDSKLGIPLDHVYQKELDRFRDMGRQLVEVTMLAQDHKLLSSNRMDLPQSGRVLLLLHLFKTVLEYLRTQTEADTVVTCLCQRHERIYKSLFFRPLAGLRYYSGNDVSDAPGFFLDLTFMERNSSQPMKGFFKPLKDSKLAEKFKDRFQFDFDDFMRLYVVLKSSV